MNWAMRVVVMLCCVSTPMGAWAVWAGAGVDAERIPPEVRPFVPPGATVVALEQADLSLRGSDDVLLILEIPREAADGAEGARSLRLLLRQPDGSLRLATSSDSVVMCRTCGGVMGDPLQRVDVGPGRFTIGHYGGSASRWTATYTFGYSRRDRSWQLVKVEMASFRSTDPERSMRVRTYRPPRDFGKIDVSDFDPDRFLGVGPK